MSEDNDDVDSVNEVTSEETLLNAQQETKDSVGDEFSPFDEIADDYKPSEIKKVIGEDGLPTNAAPVAQSDIPPLSPETLVCMEDTSKFVTRDEYGKIISVWEPDKVEQLPNGKYYLKDEHTKKTEVQPIRPRCQHYVRQMAMFDYNAAAKVHLRLCSARRTTEGTFMTVRDSAMWGCSMREPRDIETEQKCLDEFDAQKIEQGKNREHFSIFKKEEDNG